MEIVSFKSLYGQADILRGQRCGSLSRCRWLGRSLARDRGAVKRQKKNYSENNELALPEDDRLEENNGN
ncbi:hypothetical protein GCM10011289_11360 [Paludibacterium paludis]|uniref:Uncharacterized protein n=1 Tax=Paludibacterium paludis TaxID=1225769 RepID=A0A918U871_9NEIS|nr:hypothetical protein GCM10011289_11360 [Paludibacterium paludis]